VPAAPQPTPLYEAHKSLGAKMTTFGPWVLPLCYSSIIEEHLATRERAGLFDTCHMGEIGLAGPGALPTLERIFTRRVEDLAPGRARYGFLTTEEGTVVDDCILYAMPEEEAPPLYILCVNAGDIPGDLEWVRSNAVAETVVEDLSPYTGKIDLQGPKSGEIMAACLGGTALKLKRFGFAVIELFGQRVIVSRSGYTGEDGFEIFAVGGRVRELWDKILQAGKPYGLVPAGLGARDTLRTEACLPLYGHELSREITPVEAGFAWAVCLEKDFLGREVLKKQIEEGPARRIMPFRMAGPIPARPGYPVYFEDRKIGTVTSGTYLPSLRGPGGMCLVEAKYAREGLAVSIEIRGRRHDAYLVARPLFKRRSL